MNQFRDIFELHKRFIFLSVSFFQHYELISIVSTPPYIQIIFSNKDISDDVGHYIVVFHKIQLWITNLIQL